MCEFDHSDHLLSSSAQMLKLTLSLCSQVELSSTNADGSLDVTYVVSLYPVSMATAVIVKNVGTRAVSLTSAILSHIKFHARRHSAIQGLRGCSYCAHPPPASSFGLLSPSDAMQPDPPSWFSFPGSSPSERTENSWSVEEDLYTLLRGKFSRVYAPPPEERLKRIYSTPPSKYTTIDQVVFLSAFSYSISSDVVPFILASLCYHT